MEKVSVVVPIYKVEKYLKDCIDSIIGQTYKNLEIILIDDGSPDICPQICDYYASIDSRIRVIHKLNAGISAARNSGIDCATGKYISFIDGDDRIDSKFIERLLTELTENQADISVCNYIKVYDNGKCDYDKLSDTMLTFTNIEGMRDILSPNSYTSVISCNKLYKAELFKKNNVRFPVGKIHEDNYTTYKLYYYSRKIVYFDEPLYLYIQRGDSIMGRTISPARLDQLGALREQKEFIQNKQLPLEGYHVNFEILTSMAILNELISTQADNSYIWDAAMSSLFQCKNGVDPTIVRLRHRCLLLLALSNVQAYIAVRRIYGYSSKVKKLPHKFYTAATYQRLVRRLSS